MTLFLNFLWRTPLTQKDSLPRLPVRLPLTCSFRLNHIKCHLECTKTHHFQIKNRKKFSGTGHYPLPNPSVGQEIHTAPTTCTLWDACKSKLLAYFVICLHCLNCTKVVQSILRKIIKIFATRCQILRLKCTKLDLGRSLGFFLRPLYTLVIIYEYCATCNAEVHQYALWQQTVMWHWLWLIAQNIG